MRIAAIVQGRGHMKWVRHVQRYQPCQPTDVMCGMHMPKWGGGGQLAEHSQPDHERTHLQLQGEVSVPCMDQDCGNRAAGKSCTPGKACTPNWGGGVVLTKHTLDEATRKKAPGPSWCRPLSRGAKGRRLWPAMTRSATCPSIARSSYSSLPHPPPAQALPTLES